MQKKASTDKKVSTTKKKMNDNTKKLISQRTKEFMEWKVKNVDQKWFFSQDERSQRLLEDTYVIVLQLCPSLTREDYINRLRIADNCDKTKKVISKINPLKFLDK